MVSIDQEKNEASDIFVLKECYECEKQTIKKTKLYSCYCKSNAS